MLLPSNAITTTTTTEDQTLLKRNPPISIQNLHLAKAAHFATILPTTHASALLSDLYAEIHAQCITYWLPNLPPLTKTSSSGGVASS